ncbi:hypothetical protein [Herbaspirillum sp.]|uniref:hypothetical protein n=1 Tax=Herbaspirillum sp. TaxID=1890675 RepID=UPI000C0AEED9|nr:hypothetical protein [Herbaspirillum sp.]MAF02054.1 hypothetical protein [Herbaspirillum sp.]|tara:strand:- start:4899 stop:5678 length:780 start_codon:yes stop_codon:yes gene_type:complete
MTIDKRIIGEQNKLAVLTNLHRFGWLTSRMLAELIWPTASQATILARRTVKAMIEDKLILRRTLPSGGDCFTLSAAGARRLLNDAGIEAVSGKSLPLGNPLHRACANWYAIQQMSAGHAVWTEHEVQCGRAPLVSIDGKTPDVLLETEYGLVWVEVENAWKNRAERTKILNFSIHNLAPYERQKELVPNSYLFRLTIVGTNSDSLRAMWRTFKDAFIREQISEAQVSNIDFVLLPVDKGLRQGETKDGNLLYDGLLPYL